MLFNNSCFKSSLLLFLIIFIFTDISSVNAYWEQHINYNLIPETCGVSGGNRRSAAGNRIVGGYEAQRGSYPWMALLYFREPTQGIIEPQCAGSLINGRYVVTAGHCFMNKDKFMYLVLGEHNFQEYCSGANCPIQVRVEQKLIHPNYDLDLNNDIALLRLDHDVFQSPHPLISTICLPFEPMEFNQVTAAGWGWTHPHIEVMNPALKEVTINTDGYCSCYNPSQMECKDNDIQICVEGSETQDTCQGDSGGPLMALDMWRNYNLVGLTSHTTEPNDYCGKPNTTTVYTRVSAYLDWILDNIHP